MYLLMTTLIIIALEFEQYQLAQPTNYRYFTYM